MSRKQSNDYEIKMTFDSVFIQNKFFTQKTNILFIVLGVNTPIKTSMKLKRINTFYNKPFLLSLRITPSVPTLKFGS